MTQGAQWRVDLVSLRVRWPWHASCARPSRRERLLWKRRLLWLQLCDWKTLFNSCGFVRCCTRSTFLGFFKKKKRKKPVWTSTVWDSGPWSGLCEMALRGALGETGVMPAVWDGLAWVWKGVEGMACRRAQFVWEGGGPGWRGKAGCPSSSVNSRVALQEGSVTVSIHEMDLRISKQTIPSAWVAFWSVCGKFCFLAELLWGTSVYNCSANVCCHLVVVVGFKMEAFQSSSSAVVWETLAVPRGCGSPWTQLENVPGVSLKRDALASWPWSFEAWVFNLAVRTSALCNLWPSLLSSKLWPDCLYLSVAISSDHESWIFPWP